MEKEENTGKDNILNSNSPNEESILDTGNDDIEEDDEAFSCIDSEILINVDSEMYGGPLPEGFLLEETDLYDFGNDLELLCDDTIDSDDESKDRKSNKWDDFDDYYV